MGKPNQDDQASVSSQRHPVADLVQRADQYSYYIKRLDERISIQERLNSLCKQHPEYKVLTPPEYECADCFDRWLARCQSETQLERLHKYV